VGEIIRPNLVWLAGDRARTLRTAGTSLQHRKDGFFSQHLVCTLTALPRFVLISDILPLGADERRPNP
jgi:hypothetical protein